VERSEETAGWNGTEPVTPEFALLGLLMMAPGHGYELHRRLRDEVGDLWRASLPHIYNVLKRHEQRGLVAGAISTTTLPAQRIFRITAEGRRQFESWLDKPCSPSPKTIRLEFLPRLYFTRALQPEHVTALLQQQRLVIGEAIDALSAMPAQTALFPSLSHALELSQLRAIASWLSQSEEALRLAAPVAKTARTVRKAKAPRTTT
jgi:DNA-binding PadR family transcriptional regulator